LNFLQFLDPFRSIIVGFCLKNVIRFILVILQRQKLIFYNLEFFSTSKILYLHSISDEEREAISNVLGDSFNEGG